MAILDSPYFDDHEQTVCCRDPVSGLTAYIAIHSTTPGPALGGCRMWPYASEQDAIDDVLRLSRGMTYKAAVAGLDFGGGKSVIIGHPRDDKSIDLLLAMGRFVESLGGRYQTAEDVGTSVADMAVLRRETRYAHGFTNAAGEQCPATAFGVFVGLRAAVRNALERDDLNGLRVAVRFRTALPRRPVGPITRPRGGKRRHALVSLSYRGRRPARRRRPQRGRRQ